MATAPVYTATAKIGAGLVPGTADTSKTAPTNATTLLTSGSSGTKINLIKAIGVGTTVAGLVNLFLHDGSTYHFLDQLEVAAVTDATTTPMWQAELPLDDVILPTGWTVRCSITVSGDVSLVKVLVFGEDF